MSDLYAIDRLTGELLYFIIVKDGIACREYPDGHLEEVDEQEQAMIIGQ